MSIPLRSHLAAGVAVMGVGALLVSPVATASEIRSVDSVAVMPTASAVDYAMIEYPLNPVTAFAPVFQRSIVDLTRIGQHLVSNPMPVAQQFVSNQLLYAGVAVNAAASAGGILSDAAWYLPVTVGTAAALARQGDIEAAISVFEAGTIGRVEEAVSTLISGAGEVAAVQAGVISRLAEVVPASASSILAATGNAVREVNRAQLTALVGVVAAAKTHSMVATYNAVVAGAANVAEVTRQVTIGTDFPGELEEARVVARPQSIIAAVRTARVDIAEAMNPQRIRALEAARAELRASGDSPDAAVGAGGSATKAKPGAALRKAAADARADIKSAVKSIKKALSPKPKKAADAAE